MSVLLHRALIALIVVGNMVAFAGFDPVSRAITAALGLVLVVDMRRIPKVPRLHRVAAAGFCALAFLQLLPLPVSLRGLLQPGFREVMAPGWASLSLAPWATIWEASGFLVALILALTAARMAATRSGLPALLILIAATGTVAAILGLLFEGADPSRVLGLRDNVQGGSPYGPFVNHNHFAQAMELTIPAALALFWAAGRRLSAPGHVRQKAAVVILGTGVAIAVSCAALFRTGSRGSMVFMIAALVLTAPCWRRSIGAGRHWPKVVAGGIVLVLIATLSWTRLSMVEDRMADLFVVEGMQDNSRLDFWRGTLKSWQRAPLVGSGLGSYRYVIGMDKPATEAMVLEQAHNDWLEWASTTGAIGVMVLATAITGLAALLWPARIRRFRSELRYPLAAAALALTATGMHEIIGFGLQSPINRYLVALWIGLIWGLWERVDQLGRDTAKRRAPAEGPSVGLLEEKPS